MLCYHSLFIGYDFIKSFISPISSHNTVPVYSGVDAYELIRTIPLPLPQPCHPTSHSLASLDTLVMPKQMSRRKNLTKNCDVTPKETTEDIQEGDADEFEGFGDDGLYDPDYENEEEGEDDDAVVAEVVDSDHE